MQRERRVIIALKAAIKKSNVEKLKFILQSSAFQGVVVKPLGEDEVSALHITTSVEVAEILIKYGAKVNTVNVELDTPLHRAITNGCNLKLVQVLLKHGADVHAINKKSQTPLLLECSKLNPDYKILKELLMYEARINPNRSFIPPYRHHTQQPLGVALEKESPMCAMLLIKITLLKNFERNYRDTIGLWCYKDYGGIYKDMRRFIKQCIKELRLMKKDYPNDKCVSLYTWLQLSKKLAISLVQGNDDLQIIDSTLSWLSTWETKYPIYCDVLVDNTIYELTKKVSRRSLLSKLNGLQFHTNTNNNNTPEIILNVDCTYDIAKFLANEDILSIIISSRHRTF